MTQMSTPKRIGELLPYAIERWIARASVAGRPIPEKWQKELRAIAEKSAKVAP